MAEFSDSGIHITIEMQDVLDATPFGEPPKSQLFLGFGANHAFTRAKLSAQPYAHLHAEVDVTGQNFSGSFPESPEKQANFEKVMMSQSGLAVVPAGKGLEIPIQITRKLVLGIKGSGEINGQFNFRVHDGCKITTQAVFDAEEGWSSTIESDNDPPDNWVDALPITHGNGDFVIEPYLRVETYYKLFPDPLSEEEPTASLVYTTSLHQTATHVSSPGSGYQCDQSSTVDGYWGLNLGLVGRTEKVKMDISGGPHAASSEFVPDPPPAVTRNITGTAFDGSAPLAGVTVTVRDTSTSNILASTTTDNAGAYELGELPDGADVTVTAELSGYSFQPPLYQFTLNADQTADFAGSPVSPQTYGVSGYLTDPVELAPIVGAQVYLYDQGGVNLLSQTESDVDGHYSFAALSAFSTVRVKPEASGYFFTPTFAEFAVTGEMGQDFTGAGP